MATNELRCRKLTIEDSNGRDVATMEAAQGGAGLWINRPNGDMIAIYAINNQMAIGLYDRLQKGSVEGMNLALSLGDDGVPCVQFKEKSGKIRILTLEELAAAIGRS